MLGASMVQPVTAQRATMRETARNTLRGAGVAALAALLASALAASQLSPEMEMNRLLLTAEQGMRDENDAWVRAAMAELLALQAKHGLEPALEDHFRHARVWDAIGDHARVLESLGRYLELRGRDADHHVEALELVNHAETELAKEAAAAAAAEKEERPFRRAEAERAEAARALAEAERDRLGPPPTGPAGMEFVWVPAGEFRMGSTSSEASLLEHPVTQVRISRGFWLGKYEVTQEEWEAVMGSNPSYFSECGNCPIEQVSWEDAQDFIGRLHAREGRKVYRLPTEAEWEYAARAGTAGDRYGNVDAVAWYHGNSGNRTQPVGGKAPNAFGLHDMLGNVWEWVEDWAAAGRLGGTVTDPRGPGSGVRRVVRGGAWSLAARGTRAPGFARARPGRRDYLVGFRLLRTR